MNAGAAAFLADLAQGLVKIGVSIARIVAGADAEEERARLKDQGVVIDETESDAAKADAESHYP